MVKDEDAARILGEKGSYTSDMKGEFAGSDYINNIPGFNFKDYTWINNKAKGNACVKNVWAVIKDMFKKVASQPRGDVKYDPISPAQIILVSSLMGMRGMAESINCTTMFDVNVQNLFAINVELFCLSLEILAFKHSTFRVLT